MAGAGAPWWGLALKQRLAEAGLCILEVVGMLSGGCSHGEALRPLPRLHNQKPPAQPGGAALAPRLSQQCRPPAIIPAFPTQLQPCRAPGCYRFPGNSACSGCADILWEPGGGWAVCMCVCVGGQQLSPPPRIPVPQPAGSRGGGKGSCVPGECALQGRSQALSKGSVDIMVTTGVKLD